MFVISRSEIKNFPLNNYARETEGRFPLKFPPFKELISRGFTTRWIRANFLENLPACGGGILRSGGWGGGTGQGILYINVFRVLSLLPIFYSFTKGSCTFIGTVRIIVEQGSWLIFELCATFVRTLLYSLI